MCPLTVLPGAAMVLARCWAGQRPGRPGARASREHGGVTASVPHLPEPGDVVELTVGEVAHGGWCGARTDSGAVVFVRHALPGERVSAVITQTTSRFARADAAQILDPSAGRVAPPPSGQRALIVSGRRAAERGPAHLRQRAAGRDWRVSATGFWQVHPAAAGTPAAR